MSNDDERGPAPHGAPPTTSTAPGVVNAHRSGGFPGIRPVDLDPTALGLLLSLLSPVHPLVCAARVGVEVGALRHDRAIGMRDASRAISQAMGGTTHDDWLRFARRHVPFVVELGRDSMMHRRFPPNGDVDEWVRHGPNGRPDDVTVRRSA